MRIFLGGTCNGSLWREAIIPQLEADFFHPVVPDWTEEDYVRELVERENCDVCLYVITPLATGFYSIAEVADDSNKRPERTVFCIVDQDAGHTFQPHQWRSLEKVGALVQGNGGHFCKGLDELVTYLNIRNRSRSRHRSTN